MENKLNDQNKNKRKKENYDNEKKNIIPLLPEVTKINRRLALTTKKATFLKPYIKI